MVCEPDKIWVLKIKYLVYYLGADICVSWKMHFTEHSQSYHRNAVYWCPAFLRMQDDPNSTFGKITAVYNDKPFLLIEYSHQTQKSNAGSSP